MRVNLCLPAPLGAHLVDLDGSTLVGSLIPEGWESGSYLRTRSSAPLAADTPLSSLAHPINPSHPVTLELCVRVLGGKGGFGSQLRAAGGRMSAGKSTNVDSCRDLNGRRLGSIKEAQKQAEMLESIPALREKAAAESKAKLEALERQLGIAQDPDTAAPSSGDVSERAKRIADADLEELARKKHKFNDNQFMEESREIKENVRSAVTAALLKKRKKKPAAAAASAAAKPAAVAASKGIGAKKADKDKAKMPPPPSVASAPVTAA